MDRDGTMALHHSMMALIDTVTHANDDVKPPAATLPRADAQPVPAPLPARPVDYMADN
ncbi:hypothetical protein ART_2418 [Arthrobacter sp. PAMC 25486]|uniref:hypothetical protein n=1 Tax=Arthrobacter sp. PAMC 25486 TaxID=1494608 RepID=UPI0005362AEA|nr:hypothetical protein [Arthrobacter sp. PAMC 25486]AIY02017.1 hypothetical protein ART_2418 [Arthrobacter sp. PAMC 25486]